MTARARATRASVATSAPLPLFAALVLGLGCGRTGIDAPVDVTGTAGSVGVGTAGQGAGGTAGQGGGTAGQGGGTAGQGGGAGVAGQGAMGGQAMAGTTGGMPGTCIEGTMSCAGATTGEVCRGGFPETFDCPLGCTNGVCAECAPGNAMCTALNARRVCDASGTWQQEELCPGDCVNGACTTSRRLAFVTSETFVGGDLGGLTGADDICRRLASAAGLPSDAFAAWLSDATGWPAMRFPKNAGPYVLVDGTVVANDWTELTSGNLRHAIDLTEAGGPPPLGTVGCVSPAVWSGTQQNGYLAELRGDCNAWSDPTFESAVFGWVGSTTRWSDACTVISGTPTKACGGTAALYCFEQ